MTPILHQPRPLGFDPGIALLFGRVPVMVPMEQDTLSIRFIPPPPPDASWLTLSFDLGPWSGTCSVAHGIMRMLLRMAEPRPRAPLDATVAGLLLEMLFDTSLAALEATLGATIVLTGLDTGAPEPADRLGIGFRAGFGAEESFAGRLLVPAGLLAAMIAHAPPLARTIPTPPIALSARIGTLALTPLTLRSLRVGSGLVIGPARPDTVVLTAGDHLATIARYDGMRAICSAPFLPASQAGLENWTAMSTDITQAPSPPDARLDELRIPLSFEIGRRILSLSELRAIGEGHVLEIGPLASHAVSVIANGQRIAEGELVEIGAALAIRLTRIVGA